MGAAAPVETMSWDRVAGELTLFDLRDGVRGLAAPRTEAPGTAASVSPASDVDAVPPSRAHGVTAPDGERMRHDWAGGEPTLDDLIVDAWEGLAARATVACPICGGAMDPQSRGGMQSPAAAGACRECGTALS